MSKIRIAITKVEPIARMLVEAMAPGCERIEIAGSIRRQQDLVGDIEIVAIPKMRLDLFGQPDGLLLDDCLYDLMWMGPLGKPKKNGKKYKQFEIAGWDGLHLDLFLVTPETWGVQLAIRTGPRSFSKAIVTPCKYAGLLRDGLAVRRGRVWDKGRPLDTPEERDFLELAGGWVELQERDDWEKWLGEL